MFILRWLIRIVRKFSLFKKYLLTVAWMFFVAVLYVALQVPMKIDCQLKCYDDSCQNPALLGCPPKERPNPQEETSHTPRVRTRPNFVEYLLSNAELSDREDSRLVFEAGDLGRHEGPPVRFPFEKLLHRSRGDGTAAPSEGRTKVDMDISSLTEERFTPSLNNPTGTFDYDTADLDADTGTLRLDRNTDNVLINNDTGSEEINFDSSQNNAVSLPINGESRTLSQRVTSSSNTVKTSASFNRNTVRPKIPLNFSKHTSTLSPRNGIEISPQNGATDLPQTSPKQLASTGLPENMNSTRIMPNCTKLLEEENLRSACVAIYFDHERQKCAKQDLASAANVSESNIEKGGHPHDNSREFCPCIPPNLVGRLTAILSPDFYLEDLWDFEHRDVVPGGEWQPANCRSRTRLAIVVPYRDRLDHLKIFLRHMLPILKRQLTHFRIFVVEQSEPAIFNKAAMMNIGFMEAMKQFQFDCVIFHDVDIIMEDDRSLLNCGDQPHHYAISLDRWNYSLKYELVFGAVISLRPEMFTRANGFSNSFFGWGGEDDEMGRRVRRLYSVFRPPMEVGRYTTLNHTRDSANAVNENRVKILKTEAKKKKTDGLNSIRYKVEKIEKQPLFTWILASLDVSHLPYPAHASFKYAMSDDVCTDRKAISAPRQRSRVTCQFDCDGLGPACVGYNHRINGFNRECWLIIGNCSSFDARERSSLQTYLKEVTVAKPTVASSWFWPKGIHMQRKPWKQRRKG